MKELLDGLRMDYKRTTNYHQMWRAKDHARDWYLGGQWLSFHLIPPLLAQNKEVDPHALVDWDTSEWTTIFHRAFLCLSANCKCLKFCQPLLCLDTCHTKNRKYPVQLFIASVLDDNMEIVILCFGLAPVENTENWPWFLRNLDKSVDGMENLVLPFISDRQKGLKAVVRDDFPGKVHGYYAHHLKGDVKTKYGKATEQFFMFYVYTDSRRK